MKLMRPRPGTFPNFFSEPRLVPLGPDMLLSPTDPDRVEVDEIPVWGTDLPDLLAPLLQHHGFSLRHPVVSECPIGDTPSVCFPRASPTGLRWQVYQRRGEVYVYDPDLYCPSWEIWYGGRRVFTIHSSVSRFYTSYAVEPSGPGADADAAIRDVERGRREHEAVLHGVFSRGGVPEDLVHEVISWVYAVASGRP